MKYNAEQVLNGLAKYAENEIISKMPTAGKVIAGTAIALALKNVQLQSNQFARAIGAVDADGMIDVDTIAESLKASAERYGNIVINIPLMGTVTLTAGDVDLMRRYIYE